MKEEKSEVEIMREEVNYRVAPKESLFTIPYRVSDPDPDPQDPHVFALPGSGSGQKGKKMNE